MGLKSIRLKNGYSQEQLSEESNLSTRTIQRIEKEFKASDESLYALANVFKMDYEQIKMIVFKNENLSSKNQKCSSYLEYAITHRKFMRFAVINVLLLIVNLFNTPEHIWFLYALIPWALFYFFHRFQEYKATS